MRKITSISLVVTLLLATSVMQSQVTIGMLSQPVKGALLDLKQQEDLTGNTNSLKGVMLPRVLLTDMNSLSPMLSGADLTDATLQLSHTGLVVYNVNMTSPFQEGIYSWDGTKWNFCINADATLANNGLTMSGDTVQLGGVLTKPTNIITNGNNLEISGQDTDTTTISTTLAITSGNPGVGKVLTSDASGNTFWGNIAPSATAGTKTSVNVNIGSAGSGNSGFTYTGYSVSVPPGRSVISAGFNVQNTSLYGGYVTFLLSTSSSSSTNNFYNADPNVTGSTPSLAGFSLQPANTAYNPTMVSLGEVTFYVNNVSNTSIPLFIWGETQTTGANATAGRNDLNTKVLIAGAASENFILCTH